MSWKIKSVIFFIFVIITILIFNNKQACTATLGSIARMIVPALKTPFNVIEIHSRDLTPFYKWTQMLARMENDEKNLQPWVNKRQTLQKLSPEAMAREVNDLVNAYNYVADQFNWGISDYWETPVEFFLHGGDCEDFAIAKYAWLRSLGIAEEHMRIAAVYDRFRNMPHAVLIISFGEKFVILDNQIKEIRSITSNNGRYRILYSLNRLGWWYPVPSSNADISDGSTISEDCIDKISDNCISNIEPAV